MYFTMYGYFNNDSEKNQFVVLLDEPDLHLNPSAQKDLIRLFKEKFKGCQIIYTTHSPYMIDTDDFKGLRIIEKEDKTKIYNHIQNYHSTASGNTNEIDLMTPVVTALGLDIAYRLINVKESKIILVEGIQDYYVLKKMIKNIDYGEKMKNFEIVPNVGASKIRYLYSYLLGLRYDLFVIFDDDKPGKNAMNEMKNSVLGTKLENKIFSYGIVKKDAKLEDLFEDNDNNLLDHNNTYLYRSFYENVGSDKLSNGTKNNFKILFDYILNNYEK